MAVYTSYLKQTQATIDKAIFRGLSAVGAFVEAMAVQRITENENVDFGRLRGSITYDVNGTGSHVNEHFSGDTAKPNDRVERSKDPHTVNIGSNVEYAASIEYSIKPSGKKGVPGIPGAGSGKPFLRPAVDEFRPNIQRIFQKELNRV